MTCWVLEKTIYGWELSAPSIPALSGAGGFSFIIDQGLQRGFVGLNEARFGLDPFKQLRHAFYFDTAAYYIVNKGKLVYGPISFTGQQRFHIIRHNGVVYYCVGSTPHIQRGVPFVLPGAPVYVEVDYLRSTLYLVATLLATHDTVFCAEALNYTDTYQGTAAVTLPYVVKAAKTVYPARAALSLSYSVLAYSHNYGHCSIQSSFPFVVGGDAAFAFAYLTASTPLVYTLVAPGALRERAYVRGIAHAGNEYATRERAYLRSAVRAVDVNVLVEQAFTKSRANSVVSTLALLKETARVDDSVSARAVTTTTVLEQATVDDRAIAIVAFSLLREQASLDDRAITFSTGAVSVLEKAHVRGHVSNRYSAVSHELAEVDDAVFTYSKTVSLIRELADLDDSVTTFSLGQSRVREIAIVRGYAHSTSAVVSYIKEVFTGRGYVVSVAPPGIHQVYAWTANTATWAMSKLVTGRPASITTGVVQFDSPALKRVPNMYIYGDFEKSPSVSVIGEVRGARNIYTYTRPARHPTSMRTLRYDFGRGFHSTGYQFVIESDASFTLNYLETAALPASRRV